MTIRFSETQQIHELAGEIRVPEIFESIDSLDENYRQKPFPQSGYFQIPSFYFYLCFSFFRYPVGRNYIFHVDSYNHEKRVYINNYSKDVPKCNTSTRHNVIFRLFLQFTSNLILLQNSAECNPISNPQYYPH